MSGAKYRPWANKNEALFFADRPNDAKWCMAVVDGEAASDELVALVWGYSPEGVCNRAHLIGGAPELLEALEGWQTLHDQMVEQGGDVGELPADLIKRFAADQLRLMDATRAAIAKATGAA